MPKRRDEKGIMPTENYLEVEAQITQKIIEIKIFAESEEEAAKIFQAIKNSGISVFSWEWGHKPIECL